MMAGFPVPLTKLLRLSSIHRSPRSSFPTPNPILPLRTSPSCLSSRGQSRNASDMTNLKPAKGSTHTKKRVGRGQGSGYGGTAGRGHKGQNARKGNSPRLGFEGGQTPITRLFPKRGAANPTKVEMSPLNLFQLQIWIDQKRIDPTKPITMKELLDSRAVHGIKDGVILLGKGLGEFRTPNVTIIVSRASQSAIKAVEDLGGTVLCKFYNRLTLRALLKPHRFAAKERFLPSDIHPSRKNDWMRYSDWNIRRGYLGNTELSEKVMGLVNKERKKMGWVPRVDIAAEVRARVAASLDKVDGAKTSPPSKL